MSQQTIFSQLKDKISQPKSFRVDLPDEYAFPASYPGAKDYPTPPDNAVIDALMKYSESTQSRLLHLLCSNIEQKLRRPAFHFTISRHRNASTF